MKELDQYMIPYIISQIVGLGMLVAATLNIRLTRILFSLMFLYAGCHNLYIGLIKPDAYLGFAELAIPLYRNFINGWFSQNNHVVIPLIAFGQLLISVGMILRGRWVVMACVGVIIFLLSISPLMVGSAFPFSIPVSIAAMMILRKKDFDYIWVRKNNDASLNIKQPGSVIRDPYQHASKNT